MKQVLMMTGCLAVLVTGAAGENVLTDQFDGTAFDTSRWDQVHMLHSRVQWDTTAGSTIAASVAGGQLTFSGAGQAAWDYGRALVSRATFARPTGSDACVFTADLAALDGSFGTGHQFLVGLAILDADQPNAYSMEGSVLHPYLPASGLSAELNYREGASYSLGNGGGPTIVDPDVLRIVLAADSARFLVDDQLVFEYADLPVGAYDEFRIALYAAARVEGDTVSASFDSVSLTMVPEPTGLALLGLGGLILGHQRRTG